MREGALRRATRSLRSAGSTCLLVVLVASWGGACDSITGASGYATVTACTGPECSLQCAAQGGIWEAGTCSCAHDGPLCGGSGGSCCGGTAPHCVKTSAGGERCSACTEAAYECGPTCCENQTCLNAALGACGISYGKAGSSCAGGLVCPAPRLDGTVEDADCCENIALPGGTFPMGLSATGRNRCPPEYTYQVGCNLGGDEVPEHPVTLSPFGLDRFEVTVGRFRRFVDSWDYRLPVGAGGDGVVAGAGWQSAWNGSLPATKQDLEKDLACLTPLGGAVPELATWTATKGSNENLPISCVSWYEAFAFCAWDGGRLPTEAEWEFAAANGPQGDLFPWGEDLPTASLAVFCAGAVVSCLDGSSAPVSPVGSLPQGANRWGHRDLAGNVDEWTLDSWAPYPTGAVKNYADVTPNGERVSRGGSFADIAANLRAAARAESAASTVYPGAGLRCARSP
jgi:formylglycine-generating enzyme